MNTKIQRFNIGQPNPQAVQEKLNQLVDAVNLMMSLRGDEQFIRVNRSQHGGMTIGLNLDQVLARVAKGQPDSFHARLTDSGSGTPKLYSWKLVALDTAGVWQDVSPAITGSANAMERNGLPAASGDVVELRLWGFQADGTPICVFGGGGGGSDLPNGRRMNQVLKWITDEGPWAAGYPEWVNTTDTTEE